MVMSIDREESLQWLPNILILDGWADIGEVEDKGSIIGL